MSKRLYSFFIGLWIRLGRRVRSLYSLFIGLDIKLGRRVRGRSLYSLFIGLGVKVGRNLLSFFFRLRRRVKWEDINSFGTSLVTSITPTEARRCSSLGALCYVDLH